MSEHHRPYLLFVLSGITLSAVAAAALLPQTTVTRNDLLCGQPPVSPLIEPPPLYVGDVSLRTEGYFHEVVITATSPLPPSADVVNVATSAPGTTTIVPDSREFITPQPQTTSCVTIYKADKDSLQPITAVRPVGIAVTNSSPLQHAIGSLFRTSGTVYSR